MHSTGNLICVCIVSICSPAELGEFWEDLELDFKLFFFADSGSAYIVLKESE